MSVRIMTKVWEVDLPDSQKIVLLALADCANDEGTAWPSIASLARKCSRGERTVQGVIKQLVAAGHLTRTEVPGRGCSYLLHPRSGCAPAEIAPPQRTAITPAAAAPHPRSGCGQTVIEPSGTVIDDAIASSPRAARSAAGSEREDPYPRPAWAEAQVWADFLANRKAKRSLNTATAYKRLLDDIARLSDEEWPPGRLLEHAVARGWAGIYDPREKRNDRHQASSRRETTRQIGQRVAARLSQRGAR